MKTSHCDPRLLTRFSNRAFAIGSSAALTLGLGMTGFVPAAFAAETTAPPADEVSSQESPATLTTVEDSTSNDPTTTDSSAPVAADSATPTNPGAGAPAGAPAASAKPSDPGFTVTDVEDSEISPLSVGTTDTMYGDALVKLSTDENYTTQHDDTFKVNSGDTLDIKSNLDVTVGLQALEGWQEKFSKVKPDNLTYSKAHSYFETIISIPEYLEMPSDPQSYKLETHNGAEPPLYRIANVVRSAKRLAITLVLDEFYEKGNGEQGAFLRLKDGFAAYANKPLSLVISGVKVKDGITTETQTSLKFRTTGGLSVEDFYSRNSRDRRYFNNFTGYPWIWSVEQDQGEGGLGYDGSDPKQEYGHVISLTMDIKPKPTPAEPENPNPNPPVTPDTPSVDPGHVPGGTVVPPSEPVPPVAGVTTPAEPEPPVAGVTTTPAAPEPPVAGVTTPAAPQIPVAQDPDKALAATGSSAETLAGGAMIVFLAGGAMMVASRRRARR